MIYFSVEKGEKQAVFRRSGQTFFCNSRRTKLEKIVQKWSSSPSPMEQFKRTSRQTHIKHSLASLMQSVRVTIPEEVAYPTTRLPLSVLLTQHLRKHSWTSRLLYSRRIALRRGMFSCLSAPPPPVPPLRTNSRKIFRVPLTVRFSFLGDSSTAATSVHRLYLEKCRDCNGHRSF